MEKTYFNPSKMREHGSTVGTELQFNEFVLKTKNYKNSFMSKTHIRKINDHGRTFNFFCNSSLRLQRKRKCRRKGSNLKMITLRGNNDIHTYTTSHGIISNIHLDCITLFTTLCAGYAKEP